MDTQCMQNRRLVGARINELRRTQSLSLGQRAQLVNMDCAYICNLESGQANAALVSLSKIAAGLDVEVIELFEPPSNIDYAMSKVD